MGNEVSTTEAAEMLGVTPHQVRWYHARGLLAARRIADGSRRAPVLAFRRDDIEAFEKPKKSGRPRKSPPQKKKGTRSCAN